MGKGRTVEGFGYLANLVKAEIGQEGDLSDLLSLMQKRTKQIIRDCEGKFSRPQSAR